MATTINYPTITRNPRPQKSPRRRRQPADDNRHLSASGKGAPPLIHCLRLPPTDFNQRLKQITTSRPQRNTLASSLSSSLDSHLRVTVTSGGCHGFQYLMSLEGPDKIDEDEDTIFSAEADPSGSQAGRAEVVMDQPSLELLKVAQSTSPQS